MSFTNILGLIFCEKSTFVSINKINSVNNFCVEQHGGYFFVRKLGIILLISCIITLTAVGLFQTKSSGQVCDEYIRIHIRADSDDEKAQAVKYKVRDAVVKELSPIVAECDGFEEAARRLKTQEKRIAQVSTNVLKEHGFDYAANAQVRTEFFPTRVYGEYTLPAGEYLSLIVELGEAQGQNWWCVIYPPLCFSGQAGVPVRYKSKIAEIIQEWKENRK